MEEQNFHEINSNYVLYKQDKLKEKEKNVLNCPFLVSKEVSKLLQEIYDKIKENTDVCVELMKNVKISEDYLYIIINLHTWLKEQNCLADLYINTVINYEIKLAYIESFLKKMYEKFKQNNIIIYTIAALDQDDIINFINLFPYIDEKVIFDGMLMKLKKSEFDCQIIKKMVFSGRERQETIGSQCYKYLNMPDFNLNHLVNHTKDEVIVEVIRQLKDRKNNDIILEIIFRRGSLDLLFSEAIKKLDVELVSQENLIRIYSFFHINPLNYIKYEIYKYGFEINEQIAIDIIKVMENVYSETTFETVETVLKRFEITQNCHNQIISCLNSSNLLFKTWACKILNTENISLPYFVKFCWFIANEDDLDIVKMALEVLKKGKKYNIIQKWAKMKKLERLTRRIYPVQMEDKSLYIEIFHKCQCHYEKNMLKEVYNLDKVYICDLEDDDDHNKVDLLGNNIYHKK